MEPPDDSASPVLDPEPEPTEQHSEEPAPTEQASDAEQETAGGGGWLAWIVGLVILAAAGCKRRQSGAAAEV